MGWKDLFVKSDEDNKKTSQPVEETTEKTKVSNLSISPSGESSSAGIPNATAGVVTEKFVDILSDKLDSLNLEGEDYYELREALDSLLKINGMTEQVAYVSAFATLQTKGLTVEIINSSIDHYIAELNKEKDSFKVAQAAKYDETVGSIDTEISELNTANEEANVEILRLTALMQENTNVISEKTVEMNANRVELEQKQNNFDATLSHFTTMLESDKNKVSQYLTTNTSESEV